MGLRSKSQRELRPARCSEIRSGCAHERAHGLSASEGAPAPLRGHRVPGPRYLWTLAGRRVPVPAGFPPTTGPLGDISERCGSSRFVALDLLVEFNSPGAQRRCMERAGSLKDGETRVSDWRDAIKAWRPASSSWSAAEDLGRAGAEETLALPGIANTAPPERQPASRADDVAQRSSSGEGSRRERAGANVGRSRE